MIDHYHNVGGFEMKLIIAIAIALFLAIPSSMAQTTWGCTQTIPAQEGNVITLTMTPDKTFLNYAWTLPAGLTLEPTYSLSNRVIKVRVEELDSCTSPDYKVLAHMEVNTNLLSVPGDCIDECNIYVHACPVNCPPTDDLGTICTTDWTDQTNVGSDGLWTLTVYPVYDPITHVGSGTWTTGTTFTWKITETSDQTWSHTYAATTNNYIDLAIGAFDPPTVDHPKKCFRVDVLVKDALGKTLLDTETTTGCGAVGTVCLVFDPTVTVTSSVA